MHNLYIYLFSLATFLVIDLTWLGVVAKNYYRKNMGQFMAKNPNWPAAIIFYMFYVFVLFILVIHPAVVDKSGITKWWMGGLFGLGAYATYDLTNLAVMKKWPLGLTIVDLIWGGILTSAVSIITLAVFAR